MSLLILILSTTMTQKVRNTPKSILNNSQTRSQINPKEDTLGTILPKQAATLTTKSMQKTPKSQVVAVKPNDIVPSKSIYQTANQVLRVVSINVNGLRAAEKKDSLSGWLSAMPMWSVSKNHASLTNNGRINFAQRAGIRIYLLPKKQAMLALLFIAAYLLCRW